MFYFILVCLLFRSSTAQQCVDQSTTTCAYYFNSIANFCSLTGLISGSPILIYCCNTCSNNNQQSTTTSATTTQQTTVLSTTSTQQQCLDGNSIACKYYFSLNPTTFCTSQNYINNLIASVYCCATCNTNNTIVNGNTVSSTTTTTTTTVAACTSNYNDASCN